MFFISDMHCALAGRRHRSASAPISVAVGLLIALGLMLLLAGPASARHHQFRYGVVEGSTLQPYSDIAAIASANVKVLRFPVDWGRVEVERGQRGRCNALYDWSPYDEIVSQAARKGVRLAPFIVGSPDYVSQLRTRAPSTRSRAIEDYQCFLRALVERYGRGGEYLTADPDAKPIRDWQVWNEPNLEDYAARGKPNPREYARLLKLSHRIIVDVDPRAQVILAGMPEIPGRGFYVHKFLKRFYKVRGIERRFDAVALHPYARNWRGVEGALIRLRRTLRRVHDARRTVWVSEFGWSDLGPRDAFQVKGPKGQATQLKKATRMMRNKRKRYNLGTIFYFRWRDVATRREDGERFDYAGLYRQNGRPKRACRAYVSFTKGECPRIEDGAPASAASGGNALLEPRGAAAQPSPSPPE